MKIETKKKLTKEWFIKLQNIICNNVEQLEREYGSNIKFKRNKWKYGEFRTIKGEVVEKGGVAFSNVIGKFPKEFAKTIPGTKNNTYFWSSGVSVVFHPKNPKVPAMHFNTRFICTQKKWFGGGMDVTPCLVDVKEKYKIKIISALTINNKDDVNQYKKYETISDIILFDGKGYEKSIGFNHKFIESVPNKISKMIAGNIKIEDISNFKNTKNYILDLSGALEKEKGVKDINKIDKLLNSVHNN